MDKLRAMTTFVHIVDSGSLTAAADVLNSSLPAVVRQLAALEQSLDVRLLNRTTRRIALTEEGRDYYERCKRILAEVDEADAAVGLPRESARGTLRITAPTLFGRMHIGPAVTGFLKQYPGVSVELLLLDRVVNLLDEGLDLALRIAPLPDSSLVAVPVGSVRRLLCASPDYLSRAGMPASPRDLTGHACLHSSALSPNHEWSLFEGGRKLTVSVDGPLSSNQAGPLIDACLEGLGIGMFLSYQIAPLLAEGKLLRVLPEACPPPVPVSVVYPHAKLLPVRTRLFINWLRDTLPARIGQTP